MSEPEQSKAPVIRADEKGDVGNTIAPSKKETTVLPAKTAPSKKNVEKKEKIKTKAELAEEAQKTLGMSKQLIRMMLEKNIDCSLDDIKAQFPNVDPHSIAGIKSNVKMLKQGSRKPENGQSLTQNEDTPDSETGDRQHIVDTKTPKKAITLEGVSQLFLNLGVSESLAKQAANEIVNKSSSRNTANFTKKPEEGTGNGEDDDKENPPGKEAPKAPKADEDAPITQKQFMEFLSEQRKLQGVKGGILARPDAADNQVDAETVRIDIGSAINRSIWFTPKSLLLFDISKENGYEGDLSAFLNDCISKLFEKKNLKVGFMNLREM